MLVGTGVAAITLIPFVGMAAGVSFGVAANIAVVHAFLRVLVGHEDHLWEPTRRAPMPEISVSA